MKRAFDVRRLDVAAFAKAAAWLSGAWPLAQFERLRDVVDAGSADEVVTWRAEGYEQAVRGAPPQVWLCLQARADAGLRCQRCLHPVRLSIDIERRFLFVTDEDAAEKLDAELDDDVLAMTRELDVQSLLEDELLLSLPLVPRHDVCPTPLLVPSDSDPPEANHPFAGLVALRRRTS